MSTFLCSYPTEVVLNHFTPHSFYTLSTVQCVKGHGNEAKKLFVFSPGETRAVEVPRSVVDSQLGGKNNAAPLSLLQPTTNQLGIINFWIRYIFENVDEASNTSLVW